MKLRRISTVLLLLTFMAGVAYVGQTNEPPVGLRMTTAAERFLATLDKSQKEKATFGFEDKERVNWYFTPQQDSKMNSTRKGLPLAEMTDEQKKAALELVAASTGAEGNKKATTIMSLESILRDLERGGRMVRNPEWYFFTVFGTPSKTGKWGWRVEGHHLSLNFMLDGGQVVSSTPAFFGANPATVLAGDRKGLRALSETEDLAKELFQSLDAEQRKTAAQEKPFPEIKEKTTAPDVGPAVGLPAKQMTEAQRTLLAKLLQSYADRMPGEVAEKEMNRVREAGMDRIHFAFSGGVVPREAYTYRLQGPTFVVEFINVQADSAGNKANHIHSCWRNLAGDFGIAAK